MHRSLSNFLSRRADLQHDRAIPAETKRFIAQVASAEREMARATDPAEHLLSEIADAQRELIRHTALYTFASDSIASVIRTWRDGSMPEIVEHRLACHREERVRAEAEIVEATERLEDLLCRLRMHVRPLPNAMHTLSHAKEGAA